MNRAISVLLALLLSACTSASTLDDASQSQALERTQAEQATTRSNGLQAGDQPTLLGVDLTDTTPPPVSPRPSSGADSSGIAVSDEDLHEHAIFEGPHPWPEPPNEDAEPESIARYVSAVLFNTGPSQGSQHIALDGFLSPALASEFAAGAYVEDGELATQSIVVASRVDDTTSTASVASVLLTLERTTAEIGDDAAAFEIVNTTITLAHDGTRWTVVSVELAES